MKIIYLTTAIEKNDFDLFNQGTFTPPNPASQNFHCRLIETLKIKNEVKVISQIPVKSQSVLKNKNNYIYLSFDKGILPSIFSKPKKIVEAGLTLFAGEKDVIIVYDPLNVSLAIASKDLAKQRNCPRVAILTDNPRNLTSAHHLYCHIVFDYTKSADAAISLTKPLTIAYGLTEKPHVEILGIADEEEAQTLPTPKPYIYFCGALYERYGVGDLLYAYVKAKPDYDLRIAGHGPLSTKIAELSESNPRIKFLDQVSREANLSLEKGASLLINPRRNDPKIDLESVPSKMFEYLTSGAPIISTPSPYFEDEFPNDVNWISNSGEKAIEMFLLDHLDKDGKFIDLLPNHAKTKILLSHGYKATSDKIQPLIETLSSSSN